MFVDSIQQVSLVVGLQGAGLDEHCFRIGAATIASEVGYNIRLQVKHGTIVDQTNNCALSVSALLLPY